MLEQFDRGIIAYVKNLANDGRRVWRGNMRFQFRY